MELGGFRDLKVYQKSYILVREIYKLANAMPESERYNIVSQIKRAATSIPLNIAEGYGRKNESPMDYKRFLVIAKGSANETEVLLDLCRDFEYISNEAHEEMIERYEEVIRMLSGLLSRIANNQALTPKT